MQIMARKRLTKKQQAFVEAMADPTVKSQKHAAELAGYAPTTATTHVYKMLDNIRISEAIKERKQRAITHFQLTPEEVIGSAAFQMRSSIDDVLDDDGSFSLQKARETGAIDLLKKHKETIKTQITENGTVHIKTVEIEMMTNQDARKEVASYIGLVKEPMNPLKSFSDLELAREMLSRLVGKHRWNQEEAIKAIAEDFPDIDIKLLTE